MSLSLSTTAAMAPIFTVFLFFFLPHISSYSLTHPTGFTIDLMHREYSPYSPFYNQSLTKFHRLHNTIHRSFSRASKRSSAPNTIQSQVIPSSGEYLMNLSIGTPPLSTLGIVDTGSDLIWTQCQPCNNCFKQNSPIFNPQNSSTYNNIPCNSKSCNAIDNSSTCGPHTNFCQYAYHYGDTSFTTGDLAVESFTFGSTSRHPILIPKIVFGCGHNNVGRYNESTSGIIGLGGGPLSLINQLRDSINGKFSYCLVSINEQSHTASKINFGSNAVVKGTGVVSTPLITKSPFTYYFLNLEKITVGGHSFELKARVDESAKERKVEGNIVIDSGTTLTFIPNETYSHLEAKVKEIVREQPVKDIKEEFRLCYKKVEGHDLKVPNVTFHFTGADVDLPREATFLEVEKGLVCLMIVPSDNFAIFGNLSQMNLVVGYDLVKKEVSFKRTDCTKH